MKDITRTGDDPDDGSGDSDDGSGDIQRSRSRDVDHPSSSSGSLDRYQPGVPNFTGNGVPLSPGKLRDGHWDDFRRNHPDIHERVMRKAGERRHWCAWPRSKSDPRPRVTVLGSKSLCMAKPFVKDNGTRSWSIDTYTIDPDSHVVVSLDHDPRAAQAPARSASGAATGPGLPEAEVAGLTAAAKVEIGNLPRVAQRFLLTPLLRGGAVKDWDHYYEGYDDRLTVFFLVIVGARTVTAVTGSNSSVSGRSARSWTLQGHRYTTTSGLPSIAAGRRPRA